MKLFIRPTLIPGVFGAGSGFHVGQRAAAGALFLFFRGFLLVLAKS